MTSPSASLRTVFGAAAALRTRPDLWATAVGSYRTLVPNRWWRTRPFLPVPDARWLRFRMVTAYGGDGVADDRRGVDPEDLILWLEWRRSFPA